MNTNPNAVQFYKKMERLHNGNGSGTLSAQMLRSILRSAVTQVDRLSLQDKKTRVVRDVLADLLQHFVPAGK